MGVSTGLATSVVSDPEQFERLRDEWNALHSQADAVLFSRWEWLYPWHQRIAPDRPLFILLARDGEGKLVGLLPLAMEKRRVASRVVRRLAFLGETHVGSDGLDAVALRGHEEQVSHAFAQALRSMQSEWEVLDFLDLPQGSWTVRVFEQVFGSERVRLQPRYVCPHQTLKTGERFEAFLQRTARRDNYLRRRKWLEKQPGFRIEKTEARQALSGPLAEFFRLHAARWEEEGGSQGIKGTQVEAFHRDATRLLAEEGKVRLYTLWVNNEAVASVYGLLHAGRFLYFQSGYDPRWRSKSVGLVLVGETFKDAIEQGLADYDFLRGTESYKSDWTSEQRHTVSLRVRGEALLGDWLTWHEEASRFTRNVVKRLLPEPAVEQIRRFYRQRAALNERSTSAPRL